MARTPPIRHWRPYGNDPLPTGEEALNAMFASFPSWFLRIECDHCGKVVMHNEAHATFWSSLSLREILTRMRHNGCDGRAGAASGACPAGRCGGLC